MRKSLLVPTLMGLAACTHAAGRPVPAPAPLAPAAAPVVAPAPAPPPAAAAAPDSGRAGPQPSPVTRPASPAIVPPAPSDSAARDSSSEEAFLDTLQALSYDSAARGRPEAPAGAGRAEDAPPGPIPSASRPPMFDIDVANYAANERVQYYLDYFRGRAREHFALYLARLGRFDAMLRAKLQAARLPQDLEYMALIESGLNPNAVSRRRAVGMWQFLSWTGKRYGLTVDQWVDERRDPWLATDAAIRMISELNDQFGSLYLAAAAYDAGPGKIRRGLNRYDLGDHEGNDRFFALADERFLRRETRDYVPKIIAAAMIAKEPEKWGFLGIDQWAPLSFDSIRVTDAVGLDVLARLADTTQEAMEELNPQLIRRATPPGRTVWVRVPVGKGDSTVARLALVPPERRITHREHFVSRGETLGAIAMRYRVSVDDILGANRGVHARSLRIGQRLVIPTTGVRPADRRLYASAAPSRSVRRAPLSRYMLSTAARLPAAPKPAAARSPASGAPRVHIVRPGENAWTIARRFQVKLGELLRENGLTKSSLIKPGQTLRIPG
jgi:membrane-bound lytic murein transglycosylase D